MDYILLDIGYQEVHQGRVVRYTDIDGNTIEPPAGYGGAVIDANPPRPSWAQPDPVEEPAPQPVPSQRIMSKLDYLRRFTQQERINIRAAAGQSPELFDYLEMLKLADEINLEDPDTVAAVTMLEMIGLIPEGRAVEVLNA